MAMAMVMALESEIDLAFSAMAWHACHGHGHALVMALENEINLALIHGIGSRDRSRFPPWHNACAAPEKSLKFIEDALPEGISHPRMELWASIGPLGDPLAATAVPRSYFLIFLEI